MALTGAGQEPYWPHRWQVFEVKRRLVAATKQLDIDMIERITSLPRHWIVDALVLCASEPLPAMAVHLHWQAWRQTTGVDYKPFTLYVREQTIARTADGGLPKGQGSTGGAAPDAAIDSAAGARDRDHA